MFLNREQICERLKKGDPAPDEDQIGVFTVNLRLGNQFAGAKVSERPLIEVHERPSDTNDKKEFATSNWNEKLM